MLQRNIADRKLNLTDTCNILWYFKELLLSKSATIFHKGKSRMMKIEMTMQIFTTDK
jgi:hypothetical protein